MAKKLILTTEHFTYLEIPSLVLDQPRISIIHKISGIRVSGYDKVEIIKELELLLSEKYGHTIRVKL